jgi:penicillin-binding protein 2
LNLAIGQGENSQTLISMVRFYAALGHESGVAPVPHVVESAGGPGAAPSLGLSGRSLADLRQALVAVVDRGTAAGSRIADLRIAGKTGTAQNPHGPDHGWFIAFAPAERPQIVVGAIVEFAEHGSSVAPLVTRIIARHLLGTGAPATTGLEVQTPADSAPEPVTILPDTSLLRSPARDTARGRP